MNRPNDPKTDEQNHTSACNNNKNRTNYLALDAKILRTSNSKSVRWKKNSFDQNQGFVANNMSSKLSIKSFRSDFFFVPCNAGTNFVKWPLDLTHACTQMHVILLIMHKFLFWKKLYRDQTFVLKFCYIGKHRANTKESKNLVFNFSKK